MTRNARVLANALDALAFAAAVAALPNPGTPPTCPPTPLSSDPGVRRAAQAARGVGATAREIAAAAGLPVEWAKGASLNHANHPASTR